MHRIGGTIMQMHTLGIRLLSCIAHSKEELVDHTEILTEQGYVLGSCNFFVTSFIVLKIAVY